MKKSYKTFATLTVVFATLTLVLGILFISFLVTSNTYKTKLENSYMKGFYEMVDNVNNIEVDLSKTIATTSLDSQRTLLSSIYQSSVLGINNINLLPISENKLTKLNKLLNKTGGFVYSLLDKNYNGDIVSESDLTQLNDIHTQIKEVQFDLNNYIAKMQYDYSIIDDIDFDSPDDSEFSGGIVNTESSGTDIPSLIYDGPFSESVLNKEIKGLENVEYTREDVEAKLNDIFPNQSTSYTGMSEGKFVTYNFDIEGSINRSVAVTKKGAFVLTITSFGGNGSDSISKDDGINLAQDFATKLGLSNMYSIWHQLVNNVLYVNLAPIINHVIYYSDLIKAKVDLSNGEIIGWEASGYATNHIGSREFTSSMGILDASSLISPLLEIKERNYAIVPNEFVGESSAYEFICTWKNYTYYIYIDSNTGKELNILRVIETNNGQLLE